MLGRPVGCFVPFVGLDEGEVEGSIVGFAEGLRVAALTREVGFNVCFVGADEGVLEGLADLAFTRVVGLRVVSVGDIEGSIVGSEVGSLEERLLEGLLVLTT